MVDHAQQQKVVLGFEPEPDMFIDTMSRFESLLEQIDSADLRLTLDVGGLRGIQSLEIEDQELQLCGDCYATLAKEAS